MTTTFGTDASNDLFLDVGNNISVLGGLAAILKACETATKAQLGEMVLTTTQGIPNFQTVWVGAPNYSLYTNYLRTTLVNVDGVQEVVSLNLSTIKNKLLYTATIKTAFGTGTING